MSLSDAQTYNLKVVIKETGIAADTLRAWERRYGLPKPGRTPGGHRLYSQRDIEIIKWLMAKQREGLSISRAVDLWNELTASGQNPLPAPALGRLPVTQIISIPSANLDIVRQEWLDACLDFNENAAEQILNQAFAIYPLETVCIELLQRGLHEIGELWYRSQATIQQEHFTSELAQRRLDALIAATAPPTRSPTILIGCTPNEQHTFTSLLLALLLRRRSYRVVYLGANVPIQRFNETLFTVKPNLVILAAQQLQTARGLLETVEYLSANNVNISYGGRIFNLAPELRTRIPAHFLGETLQDAIQFTETLLVSNVPMESVSPANKQDRGLSRAFIHNRSTIEMYTLTELIKSGIPLEFSSIAFQQLGNDLTSALAFGNLDVLQIELDWISGLLGERNQNTENLDRFLKAYAKSIDQVMGKEGQPISSWLKTQT